MKTPIRLQILSKVTILAIVAIGLQYCKPTQKVATSAQSDVPVISYEADIRPMMVVSCTPCHFPETGKKEMLDTYAATKNYIDDIIARVELSPKEAGYMPFKSKKEAFTPEQIEKLKMWARQGFGE